MHAEAHHRDNSVGLAALPEPALEGCRATRSSRSHVRGSGGSYRDGVPLWAEDGGGGPPSPARSGFGSSSISLGTWSAYGCDLLRLRRSVRRNSRAVSRTRGIS